MLATSRRSLLRLAGLALACATASTGFAQNDNWPQFRGPGGRAQAPDGTKIPLPFDLKIHTRFKIATPAGHSTPIVWGKRIFLSGYEGDQLLMIAYARDTGEELWRHAVKARGEEQARHTSVCPAMPTACTDGEHVYFYFGAYGIIARALNGKFAWEKKLPVPRHDFGTANSPILAGDVLVLNRDGARERAILGLDKRDGSPRWKIRRLPYILSYTTPFLWKNDQREELVITGTARVDSYNPKTGKRLWSVGNTALFVCPTPVGDGDTLYHCAWTTANAHGGSLLGSMFGELEFTAVEKKDAKALLARLDKNGDGKLAREELHECRAKDCFDYGDSNRSGYWEVSELGRLITEVKRKGRNICVAIRAGGKGDVTKTHVKWTYNRGLPYVASPLLHDGRLYMAKTGGLITCLDPKTGKVHYRQKRLADHSEYYSSPVGVDKHVVVCSSEGTLFVLKADDEFEVESAVEFGEPIHATPVALHDRMLIRGDRHMWSIGRR